MATSLNVFDYLKQPKNLQQYNLMKGITDFGNPAQWDLYEGGYYFLMVVSIPKFLKKLGEQNSSIQQLLDNYVWVLEHEFKGLSGIDNITAQQMDVSDGISTLQLINKVEQQNQTTLSARYTEKSGGLLTKTHELFLTGIKDPKSQVKTYHGLIQDGILDAGFENEVFTLMYFNTDNTCTKIERAFLGLCAQPTTANFEIYQGDKGTYDNKEINVDFNTFLITAPEINKAAQETLDWMRNVNNPNKWEFDSHKFHYTGVDTVNPRAEHF